MTGGGSRQFLLQCHSLDFLVAFSEYRTFRSSIYLGPYNLGRRTFMSNSNVIYFFSG